jgi:ABC-type nickel/cobalt efflux system permease component RcnA
MILFFYFLLISVYESFMDTEYLLILSTAAFIGFLHTILGPDHYLPFVAIARAKKWSLKKTFVVTSLCGLGHVLGSIALGFMGVFLGIAVFKLETIEAIRGDLAAWLLIIFGTTYVTWSVWNIMTSKRHKHDHVHANGISHSHMHCHHHAHAHAHQMKGKKITPWALFIIFVFGPCEALIPLIMYPASQGSILGIVGAVSVFAGATILTMVSVVGILMYATSQIRFPRIEPYAHVLAGTLIVFCGVGIKFLGL